MSSAGNKIRGKNQNNNESAKEKMCFSCRRKRFDVRVVFHLLNFCNCVELKTPVFIYHDNFGIEFMVHNVVKNIYIDFFI